MRTLLTIFFSLFLLSAKAQPKLPDMAATVQNGMVILTWDCQYDGLKSITVMRAKNGNQSFSTVGIVRNLGKGIQGFIDGHPAAGISTYKLNITFSSDLTWNSNAIKVHIDTSAVVNNKMVLPSNDSLQRYLVIENAVSQYGKPDKGIVIRIDTTKGVMKHNRAVTSTTIQQGSNTSGTDTVTKQHNISITIDSAVAAPYVYVKSHYVFTNPLTGHVNMELPDASVHHSYSVKFYNSENKDVLDVPKITESPVIIDRRNFRKKGNYKFILKEGNKDLETGYITIY